MDIQNSIEYINQKIADLPYNCNDVDFYEDTYHLLKELEFLREARIYDNICKEGYSEGELWWI